MRPIIILIVLAITILGGSAGAFAQSIEIYPDEPYYEPPLVYRYRSAPPAVAVPVRPVSCGEFRYWNGERCVDARVVPPDLR